MSKNNKSSTLWATHSMIKTSLIIKDKVDISKYGKLLAFLKRQNINYKSKKSNTFIQENIDTFLDDAPEELLVQKVGLLIWSLKKVLPPILHRSPSRVLHLRIHQCHKNSTFQAKKLHMD